jgi:hypothetical protein
VGHKEGSPKHAFHPNAPPENMLKFCEPMFREILNNVTEKGTIFNSFKTAFDEQVLPTVAKKVEEGIDKTIKTGCTDIIVELTRMTKRRDSAQAKETKDSQAQVIAATEVMRSCNDHLTREANEMKQYSRFISQQSEKITDQAITLAFAREDKCTKEINALLEHFHEDKYKPSKVTTLDHTAHTKLERIEESLKKTEQKKRESFEKFTESMLDFNDKFWTKAIKDIEENFTNRHDALWKSNLTDAISDLDKNFADRHNALWRSNFDYQMLEVTRRFQDKVYGSMGQRLAEFAKPGGQLEYKVDKVLKKTTPGLLQQVLQSTIPGMIKSGLKKFFERKPHCSKQEEHDKTYKKQQEENNGFVQHFSHGGESLRGYTETQFQNITQLLESQFKQVNDKLESTDKNQTLTKDGVMRCVAEVITNMLDENGKFDKLLTKRIGEAATATSTELRDVDEETQVNSKKLKALEKLFSIFWKQ